MSSVKDRLQRLDEIQAQYQVIHHEVIEQRAGGILRCSPDGRRRIKALT
jgi:hypothetical protein